MGRHKIPVHLETPDTLLFGLTARQTAVIGIGIAFAYLVVSAFWRTPILLGMALAFAVILVVAALLLAFVRPKNRTLDVWLIIMVNFWLIPHCYAWRPLPPDTTFEHNESRRSAQAQTQQSNED